MHSGMPLYRNHFRRSRDAPISDNDQLNSTSDGREVNRSHIDAVSRTADSPCSAHALCPPRPLFPHPLSFPESSPRAPESVFPAPHSLLHKEHALPTITTKDGTSLFYKDWGTGKPLVFHHGWPLSADDWDAQMMFFLDRGFRVIAHDRRGHGRSTQTVTGNEMNTYAADVAELVEKLDLRDAIHIGHSTGGGEVARYVAKYGK